jgi:hypothetical protein
LSLESLGKAWVLYCIDPDQDETTLKRQNKLFQNGRKFCTLWSFFCPEVNNDGNLVRQIQDRGEVGVGALQHELGNGDLRSSRDRA